MLEIALLDYLERIISAQPKILSQSMCLLQAGDGTAAGSLHKMIVDSYAASGIPVRMPDGSCFLPAAGSAQPYHFLFDPSTELMTYESPSRGLTSFEVDNSGVLWAAGTVAGTYGLWKRGWAQMAADTAAPNGFYRKTTGELYYQSSTGTWYQLANGAATLVTTPTGVYASAYRDWPNAIHAPHWYAGVAGKLYAKNLDSTNSTILLPPEAPNVFGAYSAGAPILSQVPIDSTYSAVVAGIGMTLPTGVSGSQLFILNKTTNQMRYIGPLRSPSNYGYGGLGTVFADGVTKLFYARWGSGDFSGKLQLYFWGKVVNTGASAYQGGVSRIDVGYTPDF